MILGIKTTFAGKYIDPCGKCSSVISFNHMVERSDKLDLVFSSLSDPTRRDILKRVSRREMSVGEIASRYRLTFAAVAKHLTVLERASLVRKTRKGKTQMVTLSPPALASANAYLENYRDLWEKRLDSLDSFLKTINKTGSK